MTDIWPRQPASDEASPTIPKDAAVLAPPGLHSVASLLHADGRAAEKVACLRFSFSPPWPVVGRKRSKFQQPGFLQRQLQVELRHSFRILTRSSLFLFGCLMYPLPRRGRVVPARCPGRVLQEQLPFDQTSSLPPLPC